MTSTTAIEKASFRQRLRNGESLRGTFIKTAAPYSIEIVADVGFDFVVLDAEHGLFDRAGLDIALVSARAAGIAALVRVAGMGGILPALDCGADGVLIPHIASKSDADAAVSACRYRGGSRGFTNGSRAGRYGALGMTDHIARADDTVAVIAMIEDVEAIDRVEEIASVPGIDAFFLGRGDLAAAMGESSMTASAVKQASEKIAAAASKAGKVLCAMPMTAADADWLRTLGTSALVLSSDQGFLRAAATRALEDFRRR